MATHEYGNARFTVHPGKAKIATITGAIGDDEYAVMYNPSNDIQKPEGTFIKLMRKGQHVVLNEKNPIVLLTLPGVYFMEPTQDELQGTIHIEVSDEGFPFMMTGEFD